MNKEIDDGGPAFPLATSSGSNTTVNGMTLRDWFAGQALSGLLSDCVQRGSFDRFAEAAYEIADAMLAARKGGDE